MSRRRVLLALILWFGYGSHAAEVPAVERGIAYVVGCQGRDGLWSPAPLAEDNLGAVVAIWGLSDPTVASARLLGQTALLMQGGIPESELPWALRATICGAGRDTSSLLGFADGATGAWRMAQGARGDVLSTVLAVEALLLALAPDLAVLQCARDYLLAQRCDDGYWRLCAESAQGDVRLTARVAALLGQLEDMAPLPATPAHVGLYEELVTLLGDGIGAWPSGSSVGVGSSAAALVDAAAGLRAFCCLGAWNQARPLYEALRNCQCADGSWGDGDASQVLRTTCAVVSALRCFSISRDRRSPDLALPPATLRLLPSDGESGWRVVATVFNIGNAEAQPCAWELHAGLPSEGSLLWQGQLPGLVPNASAAISTVLPMLAVGLPAELYLLLDPTGSTGDVCRGNNLTRLACQPGLEQDELSLWLSPLTIRSDGNADILLLRPGLGVMIAALTQAAGPLSGESVKATLLDNGEEVHQRIWQATAGEIQECFFEWFPDAGEHALEVRLELGQGLTTSHYAQVEVVDDAMLLRVQTGKAGMEEGLPCFGAGEHVAMRLYRTEDDAPVELWVSNSQNNRQGPPVLIGSQDGYYSWHSALMPPGDYAVHALNDGEIGEAKAVFRIIASSRCEDLVIVQPDFSERRCAGDVLETPVTVSWQQLANVTRDIALTWTWVGPDGQVLAEDGDDMVLTCPPGAKLQQAVFPSLAALPFPQAGQYVLTVCLRDGPTELVAQRHLKVLRLPALRVEQSVQPESVGVEPCEVQIHTRVILEPGTAGAAGGMSFAVASVLADLLDVAAAGLDIVLSPICDDQGVLIQAGQIQASLLYGRCDGQQPAAAVTTTLHDIVAGRAVIHYQPLGTALSGAAAAPVLIALSDPRTAQGIGIIELHLEGNDGYEN